MTNGTGAPGRQTLPAWAVAGATVAWDERLPLADCLRDITEQCRAEQPDTLAEQILLAVLDDLGTTSRLAGALPRTVRAGDYFPFHILSSVHRLLLQGRGPRLVARIPTMGGTNPLLAPGADRAGAAAAFRADVVDLLANHAEDWGVNGSVVPQTQHPLRAACLRLGLSHLGTELPVRLVEIGASAGLNLRPDLLPGFTGLEVGPLPAIVERRGCDLHPIDATTPAGRLRLLSCVWVDDVAGFARLGHAIDTVQAVPVVVERAEASAFLAFLASLEPVPGTTTVIWHSSLFPYLDPAARAATLTAIERLGRQASSDAPVAHMSWEFDGDRTQQTQLLVRVWQGRGEPRTHVVFGLPRGAPWPETATDILTSPAPTTGSYPADVSKAVRGSG